MEIKDIKKEWQTYEYLKNLVDTKYTVYELVNNNYFKNLIGSISNDKFKDIVKKCECCGKDEILRTKEDQLKEARKEYREEEGRLQNLFRELLYYEYKLSGKKADIIYSLAWEDGHAYGLSEVAGKFHKYAELIKEIMSIKEEN